MHTSALVSVINHVKIPSCQQDQKIDRDKIDLDYYFDPSTHLKLDSIGGALYLGGLTTLHDTITIRSRYDHDTITITIDKNERRYKVINQTK
jgi:hypothetical protein